MRKRNWNIGRWMCGTVLAAITAAAGCGTLGQPGPDRAEGLTLSEQRAVRLATLRLEHESIHALDAYDVEARVGEPGDHWLVVFERDDENLTGWPARLRVRVDEDGRATLVRGARDFAH